MNEWPITKLGDLIELRGGLSYKAANIGEVGNPMVTMGAVTPNARFKFDSLKYYNGDYRVSHVLSPGDLVMSTRDVTQDRITLGAPAIVPDFDVEQDIIGATNLYLVRNNSVVSNSFLYWLLKTPEYRRHIIASAKGTTVMMLTKDAVEKYTFPLPSEEERDAISNLLDALEDKIELNRRMNETLEEIARALFRDWFVDFGPTRRQMEGATDPAAIMGQAFPPEKAATLAPFFPAKLGDDGLPEGWETRELRSALTLNYGKSLPKKVRTPGSFNVYGSGGISGTHDTALVTGPSIIVGRKGTVGSLYWSVDDFFPIDTVFYVTSQHPMVFCHRLLETLGLETMNTDAAVPGLNRDNAYRQEFAYGGDKLIKAYSEFGDPLVGKADANEKENQTLAEMRDLLLPKLMSGEIRLKDAGGA